MNPIPDLDELPFLRSLLWQGETPTIKDRSSQEILQIYERGWRYRGVMANISDTEQQFIQSLAREHHSWLTNDI
jgi:hypothetical protein